MYRVSRKLIVLTLFLVMAAAIPVMAHEFSPAEIPAPEAIVSEAERRLILGK